MSPQFPNSIFKGKFHIKKILRLVEAHLKLLIFESKFSGPRKFTLGSENLLWDISSLRKRAEI